jgi:hypothetical protein
MKGYALARAVATALLVFALTAPPAVMAQPSLSPAERSEMLERLRLRLGAYLGGEDLNACWEAARSGEDRALYALAGVADGIGTLMERSEYVQELIQSDFPEGEIYRRLGRWNTPERLQRIRRASRELPQAWAYCARLRLKGAETEEPSAVLTWLRMVTEAESPRSE